MRALSLFVVLLGVWSSPVLAERRVALVVGNAAYDTVPALTNPGNDAEAMAGKLTELGFEVLLRTNLDQRNMAATLGDFAAALDGAAVGLLFYAGHGIQFEGRNYLISTDAKLDNQFAVQSEAFSLDQILAVMRRSAAVSIVVLDACRNNPFVGRLQDSLPSSQQSEVSRGLATVNLPTGDTMIVYATAANQTAADGIGKHSPFTQALLEHVATPGVEVSLLLKRVIQDVRVRTQFRQSPEVLSAMASEFYFAPRQPGAPVEPSAYDTSLLEKLDIAGSLAAAENGADTAPDRIEASLGLRPSDIVEIQTALGALGYDTGAADGAFGRRSREAMMAFQRQQRLRQTGYIDAVSIETLLQVVDEAPKTFDGLWRLDIRRKVVRYRQSSPNEYLGKTDYVASVELDCTNDECLVLWHNYHTIKPERPFDDLDVRFVDGSVVLSGSVSTNFHDGDNLVPHMATLRMTVPLPAIVPYDLPVTADGNTIDRTFAFNVSVKRMKPKD